MCVRPCVCDAIFMLLIDAIFMLLVGAIFTGPFIDRSFLCVFARSVSILIPKFLIDEL